MTAGGGDTSNNLVTGLLGRLIDLALQDDLLALDAAGLAAAVEEVGDTVLLTNARGEPTLSKEIEAEIDSADRIDIAPRSFHAR